MLKANPRTNRPMNPREPLLKIKNGTRERNRDGISSLEGRRKQGVGLPQKHTSAKMTVAVPQHRGHRAKRRVRFCDRVICRFVQRYKEADHGNLWWSLEEMENIWKVCWSTVKHVEIRNRRPQTKWKDPQEKRQKRIDCDDDDQQAMIVLTPHRYDYKEEELCIRGLEHKTSEGSKQRIENKKKAKESVLVLSQLIQDQRGVVDAIRLAQLYRTTTKKASTSARVQGLRDENEARSIYSCTRTVTA